MEWENSSYLIKRVVQQKFDIFRYILIIPIVLLYLTTVYFQIFRGYYYNILAEKNCSKTYIKFSPRGKIYDCNGIVIADNRPWLKVYYYPFLDTDRKNIKKIIELLPESKPLLLQAIRTQQVVSLTENIPLEKLFKILSLRHKISGIEVDTEYRRLYPFAEKFAHITGYVGQITQKEYLKLKDKGYYFNDIIGKTGLEKMYENYLRGEHGALIMEIDAHGNPTKVVRELPPIAGNNLHLTIDSKLQLSAYNALEQTNKNGAIVGIDPRTGAIRILVSYKSFDPNIFITDIQKASKFLSNPSLPLFNRCLQGTYPPGSTYKPLSLIAALSENKVSHSWQVTCNGQFKFGNKIFKCWEKKGHGPMDMLNALKHSCDIYFYTLALKLGIENFEKYSSMFKLGEKTGIDLPSEVGGIAPSRQWKKTNFKSEWYDGDTVNIGIGQGYIALTPIQLAVFTASIANRGIIYQPYIVSKIVDEKNNILYEAKPIKKSTLKINPEIFEFVEKSMIEVVQSGTGHAAFISNEIKLAGKTGTSQNPHGPDHALFICYGPVKEDEIPPLALAIVVEHGLRGGAVAAPIAKAIFKEYLNLQTETTPQEKETSYEGD